MKDLVQKLNHRIAQKRAENNRAKMAEQAKAEKQRQFITNCLNAFTNAALRHGMDKHALAEYLQDGRRMDFMLIKLDDINMKEEILQRRIDEYKEKLREVSKIKFELEFEGGALNLNPECEGPSASPSS